MLLCSHAFKTVFTPEFILSPSSIQIKEPEAKTLVAALAGGAAAEKLWTDGLHIAGERYVVTKAEGRSIYGRKVRNFPLIWTYLWMRKPPMTKETLT
jgi:hypothetical protein